MVVHRSASRDDGREKRRFVPRCALAEDRRLVMPRVSSPDIVIFSYPRSGKCFLLQLIKLSLVDRTLIQQLLR